MLWLCCKVTGAQTVELEDVNIEVGIQSKKEKDNNPKEITIASVIVCIE